MTKLTPLSASCRNSEPYRHPISNSRPPHRPRSPTPPRPPPTQASARGPSSSKTKYREMNPTRRQKFASAPPWGRCPTCPARPKAEIQRIMTDNYPPTRARFNRSNRTRREVSGWSNSLCPRPRPPRRRCWIAIAPIGYSAPYRTVTLLLDFTPLYGYTRVYMATGVY
jgi:hypothetical protein